MRPPPRSRPLGEVGGEAVLPRRQDDRPARARCRARCTPGAAPGARSCSLVVGTTRQRTRRAVEDLDGELVPRARAAPAGVEQADVALALGDLDERGGEVARPRRPAALVGDDGDLVALGAEPQHRRDEVRAARAEQPRGADDRVLGVRLGDRALAGELRAAVGLQRRRRRRTRPTARAWSRRRRSRSRRGRRARPPPRRPRATLPAPSPLTAQRPASSLSAPSTSVKAAQLTTAPGSAAVTTPRDMVGVGDVEVGMRERDHVVAEPLRVGATTARPSIPPLPRTSNRIAVIWKRKLRSCAVADGRIARAAASGRRPC